LSFASSSPILSLRNASPEGAEWENPARQCRASGEIDMSPEGTARMTPLHETKIQFATVIPKKFYFGMFFRSRYRTSTSHAAVIINLALEKFLPKEHRTH